ncbi:PAS domain-containing sensor histidine kinase [Variovorax sp. J22P240]|uniref:sensor histidine kinase n=1 Tax=Variovorax sp. J22P240 TaxID=3053514 RepID=UPI0025763028|nr:PAS domain-containing sensor histidine kinase [Variovorax sp. J22P240]MDM0000588.1 PAS domain-containing sensor histidine kinase [Variovorax sp. J22P240]
MQDDVPELPDTERLFDEFPTGLLVTSVSGTILKVNATFCTWLGIERDELVGKKRLQELFTMGGRIFHQTHWLPTLQMQGSLSEVKLDVRHRDGHTIPMMLNAIRRATQGGSYDEISMVVAEERNKYERELLAARKRADELVAKEREVQATLQVTQARLREALRLGNLFLWDVDAATGLRRYEDDVARLLGYPTPRPVDDTLYAAAVEPADRDSERRAMDCAQSPTDEVSNCSYRLNGVDGVQRTVVSSGHGFFNADGTLAYFVGVLSDVTEATRERARAQDRALFAEQMVGIVSHDLRNPLSAILTGAKVLAHGETVPGKQRVLGHVTNSAQRAHRLIEELLDFTLARVGRGLAVSPARLDLHALVAGIVDELRLAFPERTIVHHAEGEGECTADSDRVAQLLGNLVGNAMAYGEPGSVITVESKLQAQTASLSVHNWGEPIAQDMQSALFEPMVRGDPGEGAGRSVGLGLFIVRAIALAHGGDVSVSSSRATGTTFSFHFPNAG